MRKKATLKQEQIDYLESLKKQHSFEQIIRNHLDTGYTRRDDYGLKGVSVESLVRSLVCGYIVSDK